MNISSNEHKLLKILWKNGEMQANHLFKEMEKNEDWKRSTTYTVIEKCIEKGFIRREEPNFVCHPTIKKSDVQRAKITDLLGEFFNNSNQEFIKAFLDNDSLSEDEVNKLNEFIDKEEKEK